MKTFFQAGESNEAAPNKSNRTKHAATKSSKATNSNLLYNKLSPSLQSLVTNISSMGFEIDRVAWVTEKLGKDDKKVKNTFNISFLFENLTIGL